MPLVRVCDQCKKTCPENLCGFDVKAKADMFFFPYGMSSGEMVFCSATCLAKFAARWGKKLAPKKRATRKK